MIRILLGAAFIWSRLAQYEAGGLAVSGRPSVVANRCGVIQPESLSGIAGLEDLLTHENLTRGTPDQGSV